MSDKPISECTDEELFKAFVERLHRLDPTVTIDLEAGQSLERPYRVEGWGHSTVNLKAVFSASGQLTYLVTY